jgi:GNAT superfamily N-acetyltransferase
MKYFIFHFNRDVKLISSFLKSASLAHHQKLNDENWFYWKFRDNPFGESILACAIEGETIVGCVALGMQDFYHDGLMIKSAISFETFVHPNHQGKGIFKNLIELAEFEAKKRKVLFLLNFPNSNSLRGFLKSGWDNLDCSEYWLNVNSFLKIIFKFKELKKTFTPNPSNLKINLKTKNLTLKSPFVYKGESFQSVVTEEYLKWRFFTYPNSEYQIINNKDYYTIARIGYRGKLKETQVLLVKSYNFKEVLIENVVKEYKKQTDFDIISFPISKSNTIRKKLKSRFFVKVPNKTNVTYKLLDKRKQFNFKALNLSAINYHTY